jgi:F0F1-type ATP synthase delta subunit
MDDSQVRRINEAAQQFAEALVQAYRTATDRTVSAQELNAELTQQFFNSVINNLRSQAEDNREMIRELVDQQQRQQAAAQSLAQESANAYMGFLNSMFSFYRRSMDEAEKTTEARVEEAERTTEASVEETEETVEASPEGAPESRVVSDLPLEGYDSMNVRQVSERLGELSVEQIRQLRDYEARNKNRRTLLNRFDARIEAGSS